MTIRCPHCSETQIRTKLRRPFQLSPGMMVFVVIGGGIGGLLYGLGLETKFQCGRCNGVFFSHTAISRIFFVLCIITYTMVAALIAYAVWTVLKRH